MSVRDAEIWTECNRVCAYLCANRMSLLCGKSVSRPFKGGPWEGKGQPRAGVNTTFKRQGEERAA